MARGYDVAIVGAGVCGMALAYYCATAGLRVMVLERKSVGASGATQASRGIVRMYDPRPQLMEWSADAIALWRQWSLPGPSPFTACGVLYLVAPANSEEAQRASRAQTTSDYPIQVLRGRELQQRFPMLALTDRDIDEQVGLFEPLGGYCDPRLAANLYGHALRRAGAAVLEGIEVLALDQHADSVRIITSTQQLHARAAVVASGAQSRELVADLPLTCRSIPISCFELQDHPVSHCIVDEVTGAYCRPESRDFYYCGGAQQVDAPTIEDLPAFGNDLHDEHRRSMSALLRMGAGTPVAGVMGADAYTPDYLPLLGFRTEQTRICLATGFSGRGAKYIPAVARALGAEIRRRVGAGT